MEFTKEQIQAQELIELRLVFQRAIELMDNLEVNNDPFKNKQLNSQLKGVYGVLDKQTKRYDDMYKVSPKGTTTFYNVVCESAKYVMTKHLFDKAGFVQYQAAHDINPKAVEGIVRKILKG